MTLTLTSSIGADAIDLEVTGDVPAEIGHGYLFRIGTDSELLELRNFGPGPIITPTVDTTRVGKDANVWLIRRGLKGSAPESHTSGAEIKGATDAYTSGSDEDEPSVFPAGGGSFEPGPYIGDPADQTPEAIVEWLIDNGFMDDGS